MLWSRKYTRSHPLGGRSGCCMLPLWRAYILAPQSPQGSASSSTHRSIGLLSFRSSECPFPKAAVQTELCSLPGKCLGYLGRITFCFLKWSPFLFLNFLIFLIFISFLPWPMLLLLSSTETQKTIVTAVCTAAILESRNKNQVYLSTPAHSHNTARYIRNTKYAMEKTILPVCSQPLWPLLHITTISCLGGCHS